jgi:hypothetical protein
MGKYKKSSLEEQNSREHLAKSTAVAKMATCEMVFIRRHGAPLGLIVVD